MKNNYLYCLSFFMLMAFSLNAQNNPYYFTVGNGTYEDLTGTTSINNGMTWDDPEFVFPLGFDVELLGRTNDTLYMNEYTGAFLSLDQESSGVNTTLIIPYGSDIADRGYMSGTSVSPISYKVEGAPGSQIFKAEWKNAGFYNELDLGTNNSFVNFQLWLYEGSNDMEVHFGPNNIVDFELIHDFNGPLIGYISNLSIQNDDFDAWWYLTGDPTAPIVDSLVNIMDEPVGLNATIPPGTIYRFSSSPTVSVHTPSIDHEVAIYPSIVQNDFVIRFDNPDFNEALVEIFDAYGKLISQQPITNKIEMINAQNLNTGMYFIHIKTEKGEAVKKIVKQ
jgi:hypothetical protein